MSDRQTTHPIDPQFTQRWSPRAFNGEPLPEGELLRFLEAARWAPSAYNSQPWRFVWALADTPEWGPLFGSLVPFNQGWAQHASALVAVVAQRRWTPPGKSAPEELGTHAFDTGAAWAQLALQASLAGWYTHGMSGFDATALRSALGIPAEFEPQAVVAIGRLGDKARLPEALQAREQPGTRLPLDQIAARGRFSFSFSA